MEENKTANPQAVPNNVRQMPNAARRPQNGSHPPRKRKKKNKKTLILQRRLIALGVAVAIFLIIFLLGSAFGRSRGAKLTQQSISDELAALTDLSTTSYHYTNTERFENVEDFYGWDASNYSSGFTLSYSGTVAASVDGSKATVVVKGKSITITLPESTIIKNDIDESSLSVYDSKQGAFSTIQVSDFNGFKENQQPVVEAKAAADGVLTDASAKAQTAAKKLVEAMTGGSSSYTISVK